MARTITAIRAELDEAKAKRSRIENEMNDLHRSIGDDTPTAGQTERWERLANGQTKARTEVERLEDEMRDAVTKLATGGNLLDGDGARQDGGDAGTRSYRSGGERGDAHRVIERSAKLGTLPAHAAEKATALMERNGTPGDQSLAARWIVAAGDEDYLRAFCKLAADPVRGHMMWTAKEQEAYRAATLVQAELTRTAMSLTDANGGYMVPLTLDPAIMLTSDGSNNALRRISRVVQTATDTWQGVTSAGATAEWKAEAAQAADGGPTVDDAPIPVHFGDVFVGYSYEIDMDARSFLPELQKVMLDAADQLMATAYTTGSGSGQPKGIVTALAGTASEINTTGTEAIVAADAFALQNALPARFQARAQWAMPLAIKNTFRQFETTSGALKFPELANGQLLGRPVNEVSNMDGSISATVTANNYVAIYGDFQAGFVIVDRIGTRLEFLPNLTGANGRPTGQRGAFLWFRTGSDVVVPQAFRMLDVPTTA